MVWEKVFHGTEGHLVPLEFGQHISKNVPNCEPHILKGEGRLFLYKYMTLIFDTADAEMAKAKH